MPGKPSRLVLAALAAAALSASCAREGPEPAEILPAASSRTLQEGTSRVSVTVTSSAGTTLAARGAADYREGRGQLELDDVAPLGLPGPGGRGVVLLDGERLFLRLPEPPPGAEGRPWLLVDFAALTRAEVDTTSLTPLRRLNPAPSVTLLKGASGDARRLGEERVDGTVTVRYAATVDVGAAGQQLVPEVRGFFERSMAGFGGTVPVEVWLDQAGRVRRLRYPSAAEGGPPETGTTTLELSDFGAGAAVRNPARHEVVTLTELLAPERADPGRPPSG